MSSELIASVLPADLLARIRERAPQYDTENRFFEEDLAELQASGYLAAPVPEAMGGSGFNLETLVRAQRLLAAHSPATALGVNMHLVWVQVARFLHDRGIGGAEGADSLDWVLRDAAAGEVFAFGISEGGNEAVLMDAFSAAVPDDAGYLVTGTKIFTTLSPVWTRLGVHARCETGGGESGADPQLIFGFVRRERTEATGSGARTTGQASEGLREGAISHLGVWNPLGMRATQSWTTRLEGVRIKNSDVAARIEPLVGQHPLILGIFSAFSLLTAAVYAGVGDRALELAGEAAVREIASPKREVPIEAEQQDAVSRRKLDDPDLASKLTAAHLDHRASLDSLEVLARDIDELRSRDDWSLALAACRNRVTDEARRSVDVAMRFLGSKGFQADSELARMYRDVLAGMFHPSSSSALAENVRGSIETS